MSRHQAVFGNVMLARRPALRRARRGRTGLARPARHRAVRRQFRGRAGAPDVDAGRRARSRWLPTPMKTRCVPWPTSRSARACAMRGRLRQEGFAFALVAECFALIRTAAQRTLGYRHYESQMIV
ncbi:hypothetical protein LP419_39835 [Massilia sp. H-1]|nr:hypothetical protein LP419_39835 [Massilia sp. H-1]